MKTIEILAGIVILFVIVAAIAATPDTKKPKPEWVRIHHESDNQYLLRSSAIIGVVGKMPGDPKERSGILLTNGMHLSSNLSLDQLEELVHGRVLEVQLP